MLLEVLGQAVDPLGQERDLDLRRAGITVMNAELPDQGLLLVEGQRHRRASFNRHVPGATLSQGGFKKPFLVNNYATGYHAGPAK